MEATVEALLSQPPITHPANSKYVKVTAASVYLKKGDGFAWVETAPALLACYNVEGLCQVFSLSWLKAFLQRFMWVCGCWPHQFHKHFANRCLQCHAHRFTGPGKMNGSFKQGETNKKPKNRHVGCVVGEGTMNVSRVVCMLFWGVVPNGMEAVHMCNNARCLAGCHCRWATTKENRWLEKLRLGSFPVLKKLHQATLHGFVLVDNARQPLFPRGLVLSKVNGIQMLLQAAKCADGRVDADNNVNTLAVEQYGTRIRCVYTVLNNEDASGDDGAVAAVRAWLHDNADACKDLQYRNRGVAQFADTQQWLSNTDINWVFAVFMLRMPSTKDLSACMP